MKPSVIVAACFVAIVLAVGLLWPLPPSGSDPRSSGVQRAGENAGARFETLKAGLAEPRRSASSAESSGRRLAEPVPIPELPVMNESTTGEMPMDVGEPLDADDSDDWESVTLASTPAIDIGPSRDADDLFTGELETPFESPSRIGETLDADDTAGSSTSGYDSISIGPVLDAFDPQGWAPGHATHPAVEIGGVLDAGIP
jgi:hypothetical protein